ncbi:MAG TPA: PAS domain S-box protein, partial [Bacteroidota bacterium]|nr:PAS domain S-box protein [Bacteroidota bacterium]
MTHRWNGIAKVTFVVLLFGLAIRMTLWLGLLVVVPGPAKQMDVREVFLILGSCLTGPIGGMFIGLISGLNASTAWLPVAMHMVLGAWVGWFYYRVVYRHTSLGELIVSWTVLVAVYYFLICLPVFVLATLLQPSLLPVALPENFSTMNVVFDVAKALASEALFTYVVSLSILLMFPAKHRAPLWVFNRSVNDNADGVAEHDAVPTLTQSRGRLGLRLMAWFLVLSLLPIAVVGVFVRDNVSSAVILLDASKQQEIARLIALDIQREGVTGAFSAMKQERWITNQSVFLVDSAETCLAGTDTSANGLPLSNAIPERLARSIRTKSLGFVNDAASGKSIGFARVGSTGKTVVVVQSRTALDHILGQLQQSIYYKLTVSLLFVSLVVGAAIWLLVTRPLKKFMGAAREVGFGNLSITLNPGDMEDEVATLAQVFNEMIDNLRQLHRDMEQEITQRKRAEEIVGERERQFRLLAENSTDMISRHDLDGRYLYVSPACRTLLGYSPEEILGRSAYEFVHEEDQPALSAYHKHQLSTYATDPVVFRCLRRDGAVVWLESTSRLLLEAETGQPTEIHVSSRDITRRRVAELALKESEVRLRTVVSNVPVVLFAINKEGIFTLSEGLGLRKLG